MLGRASVELIGRKLFLPGFQLEFSLGDDEVLIVALSANRAITVMHNHIFGGNYLKLHGAAVAPPGKHLL